MINPIQQKLNSYPESIQPLILQIRQLINETACELDLLPLQESLKWGELSYVCHAGSPIRIDWKSKNPKHLGIYFNCQTKLVATFKEIYPNEFVYQGNRALLIDIHKPIKSAVLQQCFALALQYKTLKHLPLLGA